MMSLPFEQPPSPTLRHSTRLRWALAERHYAHAAGVAEPGWIAELLPNTPAEVDAALRSALTTEARTVIIRIEQLMCHPAFPELDPSLLSVHFDSDRLSFEAKVSGTAQDGPLIEISLGALLALEDVIFTAACSGAFFAHATPTTEVLDEPIPTLFSTASRQHRFHDYGEANSRTLDLNALSQGIPRASWRLRQCDCLAEVALQWIILHELAHWALGHLGLAALRSGDPKRQLSMDEVAFTFHAADGARAVNGLSSEECRALELQADFLASELLFFYLRAQQAHPASPLVRFEKDIAALVAVRGTVIGMADPATANRLLMTANSIVIMVMEARRHALTRRNGALSHPSPESRAFQMLAVMFALANRRHHQTRADGTLVIKTTDDDRIADIDRMLREELRPFVIDSWAVAQVLKVPPIFVQTSHPVTQASDPALSSASATFQDFLLISFEQVNEIEQLSTVGAREFFALKSRDADLRNAARPFAVWFDGSNEDRAELGEDA